MFTLDQVNLSTLPSLPLECRKALPECSGIYFGEVSNIDKHSRNQSTDQADGIVLSFGAIRC